VARAARYSRVIRWLCELDIGAAAGACIPQGTRERVSKVASDRERRVWKPMCQLSSSCSMPWMTPNVHQLM
jgi:hypothetical protein